MYKNKTIKYVAPSIGLYKDNLIHIMNTLVGEDCIHGFFIGHREVNDKNAIFLIINSSKVSNFITLLNELKKTFAYISDYEVGTPTSMLHCIELKVNPKYPKLISTFMESKYSQMYDKEDRVKLFKGVPFYVLDNNENYRLELEEYFQTSLEGLELDSKILLYQEIFEYQEEEIKNDEFRSIRNLRNKH